MLDRAITLFVRTFAPIVVVLAVVAVPLTVAEAVVAPQSAHAFMDIARVIASANDPAAARAASDAIAGQDRNGPVAFAFIMISLVVRLLMWGALITVVSQAYRGAPARLGAAYRVALRRWPIQLVVALAFLILGSVAAIPVMIVYVGAALAVVALAALHQTAPAIIVGVIAAVIVIGAAVVLESLAFMAYELAAVSVMTEHAGPAAAIAAGLRRALAPGMKRRTIVAGMVVFLVSQGGLLPVVGLAVFASAVTHVDALYFAILATGGVLLDGLVATFVVVFAVDARVRREGIDLVVPDASGVAALDGA